MTGIQWTDTTWNPTTGCDRVSDGCTNCYALTMAARLKGMGSAKYQRDGDPRTSGPGFGLTVHPDTLDVPLHWRKPRKVFVNSMSDLFHKDVPDDFVARVFAVMAATPQHTYQCLTKRHGRMRALLNSQTFRHQVARALDAVRVDQAHDPRERWAPIPGYDGYEASTHGRVRSNSGVLATGLNPATQRESVTLWNHGAPKTLTVHRLVLMAHDGIHDEATEVCHRNGDKGDNRLANLRWGTRSDNQREKVRHGARGGPQRLTSEQVDAIRAERRAGATQQVVADRHGVSRSLVSMIEHGRAWAEPELQWPLPNVHLGVSVEDQQRADLRIPALLDSPAAVRFLSCEPLIGPVDLRGPGAIPELLSPFPKHRGVDWCIVGGESGSGARPMQEDWAAQLVTQCRCAGVPVFVKQMGSVWARQNGWAGKGGLPEQWPAALRVREFPAVTS